ncbi:hypothetical protein TCAP_02567 [Tolypocladium capitatum]|uniref:Uncharacterized protein n=1 Tax=Tolypocladium capitatum TaxID=45235 RepID=A0A2K3QIZ6_9HYPO|nr:hypothetical protein TCAP_02567 [Tolypocladium capitatum]
MARLRFNSSLSGPFAQIIRMPPEEEQLGWRFVSLSLNVSPNEAARACKCTTIPSSKIVGGV